ncbi:lipopolysaccharide biosynthesis protein [Halomicrobium sp. HM KBTZ05]|uniref:lipopolysaccharide biosynthesis protein n=1 Tax=Halomicrobium sp. HM KBTZ05 TaxID=3242663 RepID=UPI003557EECD
MIDSSKLLSDLGLVTVANALKKVRGFIFLPALTKFLGPEGYGVWVLALLLIQLVLPVASFSLMDGILRYLPGESDRETRVRVGNLSVFVLITSTAVCLLIVLVSDVLAVTVFKGYELAVVVAAIAVVPSVLFQFNTRVVRAQQHLKIWSVLDTGQRLLELVTVVTIAFTGSGIVHVLTGLLAARAVGAIVSFGAVVSIIGTPLLKWPNQEYRYVQFSMKIIPWSLSRWFIDSSDRFLISFYIGASAVGYYSAAYTVAMGLRLLVQPLMTVVSTSLPQLFENDSKQACQAYLTQSSRVLTVLLPPAMVGLSMIRTPVLSIISTPPIAEAGAVVLPIIVLSIAAFSVSEISTQPLLLTERTGFISGVWIIAGFLNLGGNMLLLPRIGIVGAAVSTVIAYVVVALTLYLATSREIRPKFDWSLLAKTTAATVIMVPVVDTLLGSGLFNLSVSIISGFFVFVTSIYIMGGIKKKEIEFITGFFR